MIAPLLFRIFGKQLNAYIDADKLRPKGFDGMKLAYTFKGVKYWTWEDLSSFPPIRQKHIERCNRMVDAGIGQGTLDQMCDIIEARILDAIKATKKDDMHKHLVRATQAAGELRNRPKEVVPEEVAYDIFALLVAREDEDPRAFDPTIHGEKIATFTEAGRAGHTFFTSPPLWGVWYGLSMTTEEGFTRSLNNWQIQRIRLRAFQQAHSAKP